MCAGRVVAKENGRVVSEEEVEVEVIEGDYISKQLKQVHLVYFCRGGTEGA